MEKMLDKKSRDFAKNMRDTMIYDKSKNEVQIGTNLYVDGKITSAESGGGTKLYKHLINDTANGYYFKIITTNNQPIDFSTINNANELNNYLQTENVIQFIGDEGHIIYSSNILYADHIVRLESKEEAKG